MPKNTPERIIDARTTPSGVVVAYANGGGGGGGSGYVPLARQIVAGAGLTGGGPLIADVTLDVGAGEGLVANADSLALSPSVAGAGLGYVAGVLNVGVAGLGLTVETDLVRLTSSSDPGAAAAILATDSSGLLTLNQLKIGSQITLNNQSNIANGPDVQFTDSALLAAETSLHFVVDSTNNGTGSWIFAKGAPNSSATELMRLTNSGRLGIGTPSPLYDLDVIGEARATTALRTATAYATTKVQTPLIDTAAGDMNLKPAGDIVLDPGLNDVLPGGNVQDDLGDYNRKWRTFFAAELYVETLVAQDVLSTIGGRIEVTPTTTLIADLSAAATTMDVKHNNLRSGEFAYLMSAPGGVAQIEAIKVNSGATAVTGGWRYTIVRNQDGTGANAWVVGDAVASLGKNVGEGHISLTATNTIYNHLGPTIAIYSRNATTAWNAVTPVVALGNLESFAGYSGPNAGLAIGNDLTKTPTTGFKGLTADATNGLRLFSTALSAYNGATQTFYLAPDGLNMWLGPSSADKRLIWNGSVFEVVGKITATSGTIANWNIGVIDADTLSAGNIRLVGGATGVSRLEIGDGATAGRGAGVVSTSGASGLVFWAGAPYADRLTAPFRVTSGGSVTATDMTLGTLKIDASGAYISPLTTFNTSYGYKFKYGSSTAAGLFANYLSTSTAALWLLNNTTTAATIVDANADSTITVRGTAGSSKSSLVDIRAERLVSGAAKYTGIQFLNIVSGRKTTMLTDTLVVAPEAGGEYTIWHAGNQGPGSGLNADTVDGYQAAEFARIAGSNTFSYETTFVGAVNFGNYLRLSPLASAPAYQSGYALIYLLDAGDGKYQLRAKIRIPDGTKYVDHQITTT